MSLQALSFNSKRHSLTDFQSKTNQDVRGSLQIKVLVLKSAGTLNYLSVYCRHLNFKEHLLNVVESKYGKIPLKIVRD